MNFFDPGALWVSFWDQPVHVFWPRRSVTWRSKSGPKKTMTATDVTGFDAVFSTGFFATFSRF